MHQLRRLLVAATLGWWLPLQPAAQAASPDRCAMPGLSRPGTPPAARTGGSTATALRKVYVADELGGTVSVLDAVTNQRIKAITLDYSHPGMTMSFGPHNVQAAPDGKTIWVTAPPPMMANCVEDGGDSLVMAMPLGMPEEVVVIDPQADTILARIVLAPAAGDTMLHLAHVVLDAQSRYAYVTANGADQLIRIDARTFAEVNRFDLGRARGPHGLRFCGNRIVVANLLGKSLSIIDPESGPGREVPVGGAAVQIACTADGRFAFASLFDTREIVRYELATGELTRIPLPAGSRGPLQIYLRPDDQRLYVADQGAMFGRPASNQLYEVDVAKSTVTRGLRVGRAPHGVVVSADGKRAYVTSLWDNTVSVVDLDAWTELTIVGTGTGPNGITFWNGVSAVVSSAGP